MPNTSILFWNFTRLCTKGITLYVRPMHCILVCGLQYRIINKGEEWSLIVVIIVRVKTVGEVEAQLHIISQDKFSGDWPYFFSCMGRLDSS